MKRILAAIDKKLEGKQTDSDAPVEHGSGRQVIDLMDGRINCAVRYVTKMPPVRMSRSGCAGSA
jgi:hypothetical protein